ncbi:ABC-F family ATP-binding cassette domain-containing protein [Cryobacterium frigoriphilum]|uniref:ABC-F family ATP-binding cassette domain-containing protein n=1 Tax=Cryobacterium frigoriphilum TaxID=1259150 RepID=A0A4R9A6E9_9MICO|nr:ATP-binding cassette domain-containing protein [Cryobacterium frigoriphilum]TFD52729.1 ABC-F family ATP-binding cassette domain-containing protein [Cryobacterium frigoriphilum]
MSTHASSLTLNNVGLTWPDGSVALSGISATFGRGRTGLVGLNGSGKSTLLRLLTGQLTPTSGTITTNGDVGYLPQTLTLDVQATVASLLGIRGTVDALRAIEAGDVSEANFEAVGDDWDIETRAGEVLRAAGFAGTTFAGDLSAEGLDRSVGELSGGEAVLVAIAGLRLRGAPITLLDEPTNNLDGDARRRLGDLVRTWTGALIVVSHDTTLLELMDDTAELRGGTLSIFGGPYSAFRAHIEQEQSAAQQAQRSAEHVVKTEKRQRIEAETKLAHRGKNARTDFENKRGSKIVMNQLKTNAQVSAGKLRADADSKVTDARSALDDAESRVRSDAQIHVDLPGLEVAATRRLAELRGTNRTVIIQGPERVALTGPNGVGKTLLLESLLPDAPSRAAQITAPAGRATAVAHTERIGYLAQRLDRLEEDASVLDNVRAAAPSVSAGDIRNRLARFLIRGDAVDRPVRSLSGGERFRVALACLLLADPPSQLLVLDEPTNNLDLQSVDQLVGALSQYRGGLLVVSHDDAFLARLGIASWLALDAAGRLEDLSPPSVEPLRH